MSGITGPGIEELASLIKDMSALSKVGERAMRRAAPKLLKIAKADWAMGKGPDGKSWPLTKQGKVALTDLTSKITAKASGETITLSGPLTLTYHQLKRPVFPKSGAPLPASWQKAIDDAFQAEIAKVST